MNQIPIPPIDRQSPLLQRLCTHFGCDPSSLPIVEQEFNRREHRAEVSVFSAMNLRYSTTAKMSSSVMIKYSSPSTVTSCPP
jgi:hypothetical protein